MDSYDDNFYTIHENTLIWKCLVAFTLKKKKNR